MEAVESKDQTTPNHLNIREKFAVGVITIFCWEGVETGVRMVAGIPLEPTNLSRILAGSHLGEVIADFALAAGMAGAIIAERKFIYGIKRN